MLRYCSPAPWDLEFHAMHHEELKELGAKFHAGSKTWYIDTSDELPTHLLNYITTIKE